MAEPWSYREDRLILIGSTNILNRSDDAIKLRRRMLNKTTDMDKLLKEEAYILQNYRTLSIPQMAKSLSSTSYYIGYRIKAFKSEGILIEDKPKVSTEKIINIDPMPKKMKTKPIKGLLDRKKVQENKLEVGKTYAIISYQNSDRRSVIPIKTKMTAIGCYPNHYLFTDETGRRHSLSNINLAIGEWKYE